LVETLLVKPFSWRPKGRSIASAGLTQAKLFEKHALCTSDPFSAVVIALCNLEPSGSLTISDITKSRALFDHQ